ncbi:uncharacterized protein si:ch211-161h7.4 isoform X1 [Anguilla anguilla]|uniref:uncharacterized protein si:ch211-161h7.4 isoform X1 n=2 Tax=Anguilla anguilla TaxID=7936 RepID=UPI0015AD4138|nr:uncharacterized protein si:ch211-161h7.4 isoform X1 [Anguilla anguilla]
MDRKHSNLRRPPPRLRYFKSNERSCSYQKGNVVRNIAACFDELESSSDTGCELSPLPKTRTLSEDAEVLSIMLLPVTETSENPVCSEKSPSEEFVPENISSPVGLAAENDDGHGEGRERVSPLLFETEGEVPASDAVKTALSKKAQLTRKDFDESSESEMESPPTQFVLGKHPKAPTGGKEQRKASCPGSSDEEFLSLQSKKMCVTPVEPSQNIPSSDEMRVAASKDYEGEPSAAPVKSKDHLHLKQYGNKIVSSEVKPLKEGRECSAFILKLKDTGWSKSVGFRKKTSLVPVSPQLEADEDFMILEDENLKSPRWFSIPRRTELKKNKLLQEDDTEAVKHNKEGNVAEVAADENHSLPQSSVNKQKHSKSAKRKKTNELTTVDQKTKGKRIKGVDKKHSDIPVTVQSKTPQKCLEGLAEVVGHTEMQVADIAEEDEDVPSPCSASSIETYEQADKKNKKTNVKQKEKCLKGSRKKPVSQMKGQEVVPSSKPATDNEVAPEDHKLSNRKRHKPVSNCPVNQEEQTDIFNNEIRSSVSEKKTKPSKAVESTIPETIPSSAAEQAVAQDIDSMQPKPTSVYRAGEKKRASKKNLGSRRHSRKLKKTVTEVLGLSEECEEGVVNGGDDDQGYNDPSPYPDQRCAPTPEKKQKKYKEKLRSKLSEKSVNLESDRVGTSLTVSENEAQQKCHEMGKRRRQKPGSWWLVNQEEQNGKQSQRQAPARHAIPDWPRQPTHRSHTSHAQSPLLEKQQRTPLGPLEGEESEVLAKSSSRQHHHQKTSKKRTAKVLPKPRGAPKSSKKTLRNSADILNSAKPRDNSLQTFIRRNNLLAPRNIRTSLASFGSIFTPVSKKTTPNARRGVSRKSVGLPIIELPSWGEQYVSASHGRPSCDYCQGAGDYLTNDQNANCVSTGPRAGISPSCPSAKSPAMATHLKQSGPRNLTVDNGGMHQCDELLCEVDVCKGFKSGPSSMMEVEEKTVPSSLNVPHILSEIQMCGPPLRPMALLMEDRQDLVKWLKNVWPSPDGAEVITPEHFQWFAYRGRAMGYRTDLLYDTFSNGKILLGSYMKKPLQVDNNAIYVYNILTSTVCVTINGVKTDLSSGETFMVPCGHAYGMRNLTAEPAVLLYHRMLAENCESGEEERST